MPMNPSVSHHQSFVNEYLIREHKIDTVIFRADFRMNYLHFLSFKLVHCSHKKDVGQANKNSKTCVQI